MLVFFKLRPEVITDETLHNNILVSSMLESPVSSLYQAVRQVFAPMLLKVSEVPVDVSLCGYFGQHGNRHTYYLIYCLMCFSLLEYFMVLGFVLLSAL